MSITQGLVNRLESTANNQVMALLDPSFLGRVVQTLIAGFCVLGLVVGVVFFAYRYDLDILPTQQVDAVQASTPTLPESDANWQPLDLPRRLCSALQSACYDHYRIALPAVEAGELAVFMPNYTGSLQVSVNGEILVLYGSMETPIERHLFVPRLIPIPSRVLSTGPNFLIVTMAADRGNFIRLSPFFVGERDGLESTWRLAKWLSVDLLVASTGIYVVLGFLALLTFYLSRDNYLALWFVGIVFCAAARNSFFLWTDPQFEFFRTLVYFQASFGQLAAILGFAGALVGIGRSRCYLAIVMLTLPVVSGYMFYINIDNYNGSYLANRATHVAAILTGIVVLVLVARYVLRGWHSVKPWVFALFVAAFFLTLHDVMPVFSNTPVHYQLSNLAPLFLVVAFCFILAHQFGEAMRRVRDHNQALSFAVADREAELHEAYADIRRAEYEQVIETERLRILQDVHDGVGGRLAGLVLLARRRGDNDMAKHIEESLADLRLIIDSLDEDMTDNLGAALSLFQERVSSLLESQGIEVQWQMGGIQLIAVTPTWLVSILRALQEVLNNVVRHAGATKVWVEISVVNKAVTMVIRDDGRGISDMDQAIQSGRGLKNLIRRLQALNGTVVFLRPELGTSVTLQVPLPDPHRYGGTSTV